MYILIDSVHNFVSSLDSTHGCLGQSEYDILRERFEDRPRGFDHMVRVHDGG